MSEENSLLADALTGLDADVAPVDSASQEPAFADIVDANNKAAEDFLAAHVASMNGTEAPAEQPAEEPVEEETAVVSEESSEEEETPTDESTDGDNSVTEEDDGSDEFEEDFSEDEIFDADSVREGKFEVQWGDESKIMTWDQIQKQLSRSRSASEKSREAKELIEATEARSEELNARESRLEKFDLSNQHDRELVALDLQYRNVSQQIDDADGSVPKQLLDTQKAIVERFNTVQSEKADVLESMKVEIPAEVSDYVSSWSPSAQEAIATNPELISVVQKAIRKDASDKKVAASRPKLQAKKSMSKGKGGTPKMTSNSKKDQAAARAAKGHYAADDSELFLESFLSQKS